MLKRYKSRAKGVMRALGLRKGAPPWVVAESNPHDPEVLDGFGLFGLVVTWMEGDVIAATVRNAFAQGCDRVYLVDNGSPDDTVAQALAAGAELALSYETEQLDEDLKFRLLNQQVARLSAEDGRGHIWWMWLDADEFVHGPGGQTVRELLAGLDRRFRVVGSRYFNHYPDRKPESLRGFHPADLQPLCEERAAGNICPTGHRKHHLQRFDREGPFITSGHGFHAASAATTVVEPAVNCYTHHFPYRTEADTRARTQALVGSDGAGPARVALYDERTRRNRGMISDMSRRAKVLDHVYAQEWDEVDRTEARTHRTGVQPRPWGELVPIEDQASARWYGRAELEAALADWAAQSAASSQR